MELLEQPLAGAEFLAVDTETNGLAGERCELTEVGAVLVGGGELHERWSSLVHTRLPLRAGIQRFTGITQAMVDAAPEPELVLAELAARLAGRVLVAHNAAFDRGVLRQAFARCGLEWPDPPALCTAALARRLLPLQRERALAPLADALGIEVAQVHRALADAETCGRVLCALLPRLRAHAGTVAEALALLAPSRRRRAGAGSRRDLAARRRPAAGELEFSRLPCDPGVYVFRDARGMALYVGKSISIRSRARAHFAPSAPRAAWTEHAVSVDYQPTGSELGALVLENRLIKRLRPPGNVRLIRADERLCYIRCRLDIPFPVLDVASVPAAGHAVSVGPLRGLAAAHELVEQLESLFTLRHCGRRLRRRESPSVYGQLGRCLSPCLGDLDPNLYRRRLDAALALFTAGADGRERLLDHVRAQMRAAAGARQYERAAALRRRWRRLELVLGRIEGVLEATHTRPRLVLARHPAAPDGDLLWLVGGRLADLARCAELYAGELRARTEAALRRGVRVGELGAQVPPEEVDEVRIVETYLASHPQTPVLALHPPPSAAALAAFVAEGAGLPALGEINRGREAPPPAPARRSARA
jgi:DNA polymerase-3 subunit epsilon